MGDFEGGGGVDIDIGIGIEGDRNGAGAGAGAEDVDTNELVMTSDYGGGMFAPNELQFPEHMMFNSTEEAFHPSGVEFTPEFIEDGKWECRLGQDAFMPS
jgi:hypothetical protein